MAKIWITIITIVLTTILSGCAKDVTAEDSPTTTPTETQEETKTNASGDVIWIAIVTIWRPTISRTIDKEFTSEVNCWNYYESGVGESKFGTQHLDHQGKNPGKGHHFGPDHLEYPIRTYNGTGETGQIWLTCDIKGRYKGL
jgi:hypothetical protein|tara:strand:+ start:66 stop:491 length:426 start_codon:yes stop_codon:yes gene_type:complete